MSEDIHAGSAREPPSDYEMTSEITEDTSVQTQSSDLGRSIDPLDNVNTNMSEADHSGRKNQGPLVKAWSLVINNPTD